MDVEPLASLLIANQSINTLNLSFNEIGNKGASSLIEGLQKNNHLIRLDLNGNNVSESITEEIDGLLRRNGKNNPDIALTSNRQQSAIDINTQRFDRQVYVDQSATRHPTAADAERYMIDERNRGLATNDRLARQVDDLTMKDLRGAQLVKDVESK